MSKKKFNSGDKFILEIGEKRMALDEYEIVGTDLWVWGSLLEKLTPYELDHSADVSNMVYRDSINRQAAIKALHDEIVRRRINEDSNDDGALDEFDTEAILRRLPPAQPEQRWISCSERLPDHPENNDYYLVTIQCEHHDGWDDYVTGFAEWTKYGWDELSCYIGKIKVIAWMPLPEPYKERWEDG